MYFFPLFLSIQSSSFPFSTSNLLFNLIVGKPLDDSSWYALLRPMPKILWISSTVYNLMSSLSIILYVSFACMRARNKNRGELFTRPINHSCSFAERRVLYCTVLRSCVTEAATASACVIQLAGFTHRNIWHGRNHKLRNSVSVCDCLSLVRVVM